MDTQQNNPVLWLEIFPTPKPDDHKYDRGHALSRGGSMTGATRLAARAAQRVGAGLVTLAADSKNLPIYALAMESVIVCEADDLMAWRQLTDNPKRNALLIGPGLGMGKLESDCVFAVLETGRPCVLDADALTNFADHPEQLFARLHKTCVLTPHEGEFGRLFGKHIDMAKGKVERARDAAQMMACTVLLKGSKTIIAHPGQKPIVNNNAPPWLATAGAGDVLAGMILGLIAQYMPVFAATAAAAWLHGDIATRFGRGLIAEDIIDGIPKALGRLLPVI